MGLQAVNVSLDCADVMKVANFWAAALGGRLDDGAMEEFAFMGIPGSGLSSMMFHRVPEAKAAKNRCHMDLTADDRAKEIARLVELGATHVADKEEWNYSWTVMADPEGNEFCLSDAGTH